jgi:hypothetical protein
MPVEYVRSKILSVQNRTLLLLFLDWRFLVFPHQAFRVLRANRPTCYSSVSYSLALEINDEQREEIT